MKRTRLGLFALLLCACFARGASARGLEGSLKDEEELFQSASQLYQETSRDKAAAIEAFERYLKSVPDSPRAGDAQFMVGEAYLDQALAILKAEAADKKASEDRLLAPKNAAAVQALSNAREAFRSVVDRYKKKDNGLRASALYRLGEVAYNAKDWNQAIQEWRKVDQDFSKAYIVPESWMGIVYSNLALEQFSQAESNLFLLAETYPNYMKVPEVLYAQGIVSLHKGDYASAEKALRQVNTPEAQFYLGKTYLLSRRPFLAAAAFEALIRDFPESVLREETEFFIGDSFFLAKDYDGAITKYQRFQATYPESQLRVSALFRVGSAYFQKKNYVESRAHFQSVIDRYPQDFFAPLAQYFIAESYLVDNQFREALFAYTKVITQYPETLKISPLAHFKLAWCQFQVADYTQAAQTCRNFLALYPANILAKHVYLVMGNSLLALNRYNEAVTAFQRIIDLAPTSDIAEQALLTILQTQYKLKAYNSILTSYQFIFRHLPPSQSKWRPMSYLYAAEAYLAMNRVDEAKAIYDMLLKVYPNDPAAYYAQDGLAWCYAALGDDAQALAERQKLKDMLALVTSSYTFSGHNELGIAESMFNRKEYEDAYQLYDKFAKDNPQAPEAPQALYQAGMSLYHLRYYTQAIEAWTRLKDHYPKAQETPKAEYQIADTLFRAQKYAQAVAAYKGIIARYPKSDQVALAYLRVAQAGYNAKDNAGTLSEALTLLSKLPNAPEATDALDLMEAVFDRAPSMDFRKSLGAVIAAAPGTSAAAEAQFRIGRRLFEAKKYMEAAEEFQKFSVDYTVHPKLGKAQFLLAEAYYSGGRYPEAANAFQRLLDNFPKGQDTQLALFHLASAQYSLKDYESASTYYQRLLDDYPKSEYVKAAQFNLALAYKAVGKLDRAEETYSRYASAVGISDEGGRAALWEVFSIQRDRKDFTGAMGTLERILDSTPDPATVLEATYRKGELFLAMNRKNEAVEMWTKLMGMVPKKNAFRLQGLIKLGEVYEQEGELAKAVPIYDDLARNAATAQVVQAAKARAEGLRRMIREHKQPGRSSSDVGLEESRKTQVMPAEGDESQDAGEKPKKSRRQGPPNLPGMN